MAEEVDDDQPGIARSIADLDADDPVQLVIKIEERLRPAKSNYPDFDVAFKYYTAIKRACTLMGVDFDVPEPESRGQSEARNLIELTKMEIEIKQIDLLAAKMKASETVALDENWRARIHSYLAHIRPVVERAQIDVGLRDSILQKLNLLAAEVDRTRTRVRAAGDLLIELCGIAGAAANELRPVVSLTEKIVGAFLRLQSYHVPQLALPAPDDFDLNPPPDDPPPDHPAEA
jgi:hypothetical protein